MPNLWKYLLKIKELNHLHHLNILSLLFKHGKKSEGKGKLIGLIKHLEEIEIDKKWWIVLNAD